MSDAKSTSDPPADQSAKEFGKIAAATPKPSATAPMEAAASSEQPLGRGVDDLFDRLELGEEDFDDLIIEEVDVDIIENTRWLAVARVHCDWEKVVEKGPWLFREWAVIIAPYDGFSDPTEVALELMPIWIQIHKIPEAFRKEPVECGDGVFENKDLKYGDWIYVDQGRGRGAPSGRGRSSSGRSGPRDEFSESGRGGRGVFFDGGLGRGRGRAFVDWRNHPERTTGKDDDLMDTGTSPVKKGGIPMSEAEKNAKKRLGFEEESENLGNELFVVNSGLGVENIPDRGEGVVVVDAMDNKRHKREDGTSVSARSAASLEDGRRAQ
ncbi:hypothetical protein ACQ4PT_012207 [Festuca glaucescens]